MLLTVTYNTSLDQALVRPEENSHQPSRENDVGQGMKGPAHYHW